MFLKTILFHIFFLKIFFVFWYCLKTPNLMFLNLVIQQYNISSTFGNCECFLNRFCPIFLFLKMILNVVSKHSNSCSSDWSGHSKIFHWNCGIQKVFQNYVVPYFPLLKWSFSINMVKRNLSISFQNFINFLKWIFLTKTLLKIISWL